MFLYYKKQHITTVRNKMTEIALIVC